MTLSEKVMKLIVEVECYGSPADKTHEAIMKAFQNAVPEESNSTCVCDRDGCWNDLREELLRRIHE